MSRRPVRRGSAPEDWKPGPRGRFGGVAQRLRRRPVIERIGVEPSGEITPRESGLTSLGSLRTRPSEQLAWETEQMTAACLLVRSPACYARQLQTNIVQVVRLHPTGFREGPWERLERHKPKGLRIVLRGLGSSNAPRLPGLWGATPRATRPDVQTEIGALREAQRPRIILPRPRPAHGGRAAAWPSATNASIFLAWARISGTTSGFSLVSVTSIPPSMSLATSAISS